MGDYEESLRHHGLAENADGELRKRGRGRPRGIPVSQQTRDKLSAKAKGRRHTQATKDKLRSIARERWRSYAARMEQQTRMRMVYIDRRSEDLIDRNARLVTELRAEGQRLREAKEAKRRAEMDRVIAGADLENEPMVEVGPSSFNPTQLLTLAARGLGVDPSVLLSAAADAATPTVVVQDTEKPRKPLHERVLSRLHAEGRPPTPAEVKLLRAALEQSQFTDHDAVIARRHLENA